MSDIEPKIIPAGTLKEAPRGIFPRLGRFWAKLSDPALPDSHGRMIPMRAMSGGELQAPPMEVFDPNGPIGKGSPALEEPHLPFVEIEAGNNILPFGHRRPWPESPLHNGLLSDATRPTEHALAQAQGQYALALQGGSLKSNAALTEAVTAKAPRMGLLAGVSHPVAAVSLAAATLPPAEMVPHVNKIDRMRGQPLEAQMLSAPAPLVLAITPEKGPPLPFELPSRAVHMPSGAGAAPGNVQAGLEVAKAESHLGKWGMVTGLALATVAVGYAAYRHTKAKREKPDHWVQQVSDSPAVARLR